MEEVMGAACCCTYCTVTPQMNKVIVRNYRRYISSLVPTWRDEIDINIAQIDKRDPRWAKKKNLIKREHGIRYA
jgi:hypothetical protein